MSTKHSSQVLTLEIEDEKVIDLLNSVREKVSSGKTPRVPHVTIRGPYTGSVPSSASTRASDTLARNPEIVVSGVGRFDSENEHIVFLKVESEDLRKIWWKPDYPMKDYGFNPHITVFKGSEVDANKIYKFLLDKITNFSISKFKLTTDAVGQKELEF